MTSLQGHIQGEMKDTKDNISVDFSEARFLPIASTLLFVTVIRINRIALRPRTGEPLWFHLCVAMAFLPEIFHFFFQIMSRVECVLLEKEGQMSRISLLFFSCYQISSAVLCGNSFFRSSRAG